MYAQNQNHQAIDSRLRIKQAFLLLMHTYAFHEITITQICQEAQIVRQTFYRNFDSKEDILLFALHEINEDYFKSNAKAEPPKSPKDLFYRFFSYMVQHRKFLELIYKNQLTYLFNQAMYNYIDSFAPYSSLAAEHRNLERYYKGFVSSTINLILEIWIADNFAQQPEELAEVADILFSGIK